MANVARSWLGVLLITSLAVVSLSHRDARADGIQTPVTADETAIRKIIQDEDAAWNRGMRRRTRASSPPTGRLPTFGASSSKATMPS